MKFDFRSESLWNGKPIPLTLTLSHGEREQPAAASVVREVRRADTAPGCDESQRRISPSPEGEGRGEGKVTLAVRSGLALPQKSADRPKGRGFGPFILSCLRLCRRSLTFSSDEERVEHEIAERRRVQKPIQRPCHIAISAGDHFDDAAVSFEEELNFQRIRGHDGVVVGRERLFYDGRHAVEAHGGRIVFHLPPFFPKPLRKEAKLRALAVRPLVY